LDLPLIQVPYILSLGANPSPSKYPDETIFLYSIDYVFYQVSIAISPVDKAVTDQLIWPESYFLEHFWGRVLEAATVSTLPAQDRIANPTFGCDSPN